MNKYSATCVIWSLVVIISLGAGWISKDVEWLLIVGLLASIVAGIITSTLLSDGGDDDEKEEG